MPLTKDTLADDFDIYDVAETVTVRPQAPDGRAQAGVAAVRGPVTDEQLLAGAVPAIVPSDLEFRLKKSTLFQVRPVNGDCIVDENGVCYTILSVRFAEAISEFICLAREQAED